jgi:hypothetical protein
MDIKLNENHTPNKFRDLNSTEQLIDVESVNSKSRIRTPVTDLNSSEGGGDEVSRRSFVLQKLLAESNGRLQTIWDKLDSLKGEIVDEDLQNENNIAMEAIYKNRISKLKDKLNNELNYEEEEIQKRMGNECLVCNISNCIYDQDVFMYCEGCNIMVHRMCVSVEESEMLNGAWYCTACVHSEEMREISKQMKEYMKVAGCIKEREEIFFDEAFKELSSMSGVNCFACGRMGGAFFEVKEMEGEFCHASCAYWLDELSICSKEKKVYFINGEEYKNNMEKDEEDYTCFVDPKYKRVDYLLKQFLCKKRKREDVKNLIMEFRSLFYNSTMNFGETDKFEVKSKRRKQALRSKGRKNSSISENEITCYCFFKPKFIDFMKKRIIYFFKREFLGKCQILPGTRHKNKKKMQTQINKKLNLIKGLHILIKSANFFKQCESLDYKTSNQNKTCNDCHHPTPNNCNICNQSKGIMVKCYHKDCNEMLHVECARKINCELGFPQKNLSKEKVHSVYCENHSKSPGFRTLGNFRIQKKNEVNLARERVSLKWKEALGKRDSLEFQNNDPNVANNISSLHFLNKLDESKGNNFNLKKCKNSIFSFSISKNKKKLNHSDFFLNLNLLQKNKPDPSIVWNLKQVQEKCSESIFNSLDKSKNSKSREERNVDYDYCEFKSTRKLKKKYESDYFSESEVGTVNKKYMLTDIVLSNKF